MLRGRQWWGYFGPTLELNRNVSFIYIQSCARAKGPQLACSHDRNFGLRRHYSTGTHQVDPKPVGCYINASQYARRDMLLTYSSRPATPHSPGVVRWNELVIRRVRVGAFGTFEFMWVGSTGVVQCVFRRNEFKWPGRNKCDGMTFVNTLDWRSNYVMIKYKTRSRNQRVSLYIKLCVFVNRKTCVVLILFYFINSKDDIPSTWNVTTISAAKTRHNPCLTLASQKSTTKPSKGFCCGMCI